MARVNIFVSSTCYDLSQIRNDIRQCIIDLGHYPILSESQDFPINPQLSNTENCINAVKNEADIFVLIIGSKYGSVIESGKSITNTEFLTAFNKGIPIYTFALKQMTNILPLWEKNPDMDFSNVVDNNKVFEFLSDVRKRRGLWNFEFERAQDITEILKVQLSNLFHEALKLRRLVESSDKKDLYLKVSSKALNILLHKEDSYEIKFFMQAMKDEIQKYNDLKNDYNYSVMFKSSNRISDLQQLIDWSLLKLGQAQNYIASLNNLAEALNTFYKGADSSSNIDGLYYVACSYARSYASLLEWGIDVRSTIVPEKYQNLLAVFSDFPSDAIQQIEEYPIKSLSLLEESHRKVQTGELENGNIVSLNLRVTISDEVMQRFDEELEILKKDL